MHQAWYNVAEGIPVGVALGDIQCSFLARLPEAHDAGEFDSLHFDPVSLLLIGRFQFVNFIYFPFSDLSSG